MPFRLHSSMRKKKTKVGTFARLSFGWDPDPRLATVSTAPPMALSTGRLLLSSKTKPTATTIRHLFLLFSSSTTSSSSRSNSNTNSPASFDWSSDDEENTTKPPLPPPYNPFAKNPIPTSDPSDPTNLQEVFHNMRTEGLTNYAVKMFDGLSKSGLTHEALALFSIIKDKGTMPDVVAHTAVLEAYVNAGGKHWKDAVRTYERMLASGVMPNAYTFEVFIKGLAKCGRVSESGKYLVEMVVRGMKPNVGTYVAVFEGFVKEERMEDGRKVLEELKGKGFMPDEEAVRSEVAKRGHLFRGIMSLLFGK